MRIPLVLLALIFIGCSQEPAKVDSADSPATAAPEPKRLELTLGSSLQGQVTSSASSPTGRTRPGAGYTFELEAGEFLHLDVVQTGTDLVAEVWETGGARLLRVDTPTGERSTETLFLAPPKRTSLVLRVEPLAPTKSPTRFEIRVRARRPATAQDRQKASALAKISTAEMQWRNDHRLDADLFLEGIGLLAAAEENTLAAISALVLAQLYFENPETRNLASGILAQAVSFSEKSGNRRLQAWMLHEQGRILTQLRDFSSGRVALERSLALWRELSERREIGTLLNDLALLFEFDGQVHLALEVYSEALEIWQSLSERSFEAITRTNLGVLYSRFGSAREANLQYRQALKLLDDTAPSPARALTLTRLADNLLFLDGPEVALPLMEEALHIQRTMGNPVGEAFVLNSIGRAQKLAQRPRLAIEALRRSLSIYREKELWLEASSASQNLAYALEELGHWERAKEEYHQSLLWAREQQHNDNSISALYGLARVERALGNEQVAIERLGEAIVLIEHQRQGPAHFELRSSLLESRLGVYELMIELLVARSEKESNPDYLKRAFEVAEMSRARGFLDALRRAPKNSEQGSGTRREIDRLTAEINDLHLRRLEALADTEKSETPYDEALKVALGRYQRLEARLFELRQEKTEIPNLDEVQRHLLAPGTLLLSYHLGKERSFLWTVSSNAAQLYVLPPRKTIDSLVQDLTQRLRRPTDPLQANSLRLALEESGRLLLGAAARELAAAERVLILPAGSLKNLPFGALEDPNQAGKNLIASKEVLYLPSLAVLVELRRQQARAQRGQGLAILADPVVGTDDARWDGAPPSTVRSSYTRLQNTNAELEQIAQAARGMPMLAASGFEANRDLWFSGRLASYRYLHIATHGFWDESWPELSRLLLSTYSRKGRAQDGFLRAYEIRRQRLSAELVTLSACDSGASRGWVSEDMFGLSRGFFDAGAQNVLMSLWPVHDAATAELMGRFYRHLWIAKHSPAHALQLAQREMASGTTWPDPFYWAGFVLYGDFEGVPGSAKFPMKF